MTYHKLFSHAIDYIIENNKGNSNPYHNNKHLLFVFDQSMFLFDIYSKEYELKSKDRYELGLAALFHDFNHSCGKLPDSENIKIAIDELRTYLDNNKDKMDRMVDRYSMNNIIRTTEYPHSQKRLNILEKIIRDADTMGCISDDWFNIMTAIATEYGKSFIGFIPSQIGFLNSVKYNTPYCNELLEERRDRIKKELLKIQSDFLFK